MKFLVQIGWWFYQLSMACGLLLVAPFLLAHRGNHYLKTLRGRLGFHHGSQLQGALWLHAVSVGEVAVAATLARKLPHSLPLVVTTITPTGQELARTALKSSALADRRSEVTYLPFDLSFAVANFFRRYSPVALILVEGDYWPLVLRQAKRRGMPVAVVNGRIGTRTLKRVLSPAPSRSFPARA